MTFIGSEVPTPFGLLSVISQETSLTHKSPVQSVIRAAAFTELLPLIARLYRADHQADVTRGKQPQQIVDTITAWGETGYDAFDQLLIEQSGGPFFQACWTALRTIPAGQVVSYAQLAERAGRPQAMRAAGTACATNLVAPFIPCHRVIKSDGTIGNYGYGIALKQRLLAHEGVEF